MKILLVILAAVIIVPLMEWHERYYTKIETKGMEHGKHVERI